MFTDKNEEAKFYGNFYVPLKVKYLPNSYKDITKVEQSLIKTFDVEQILKFLEQKALQKGLLIGGLSGLAVGLLIGLSNK